MKSVGQLIEGETAVQDRAYPRLFERSDIILLLALGSGAERDYRIVEGA